MLDCWTCVPGPAAYEETGPSSWPGIATEGREAAMVSALEGKRKMDGGPTGFGIFLPGSSGGLGSRFPRHPIYIQGTWDECNYEVMKAISSWNTRCMRSNKDSVAPTQNTIDMEWKRRRNQEHR